MGYQSVTIYHPPSERTQRCSRDAYDRVWSEEGWNLVDETGSLAVDVSPEEAEARRLALLAKAKELGLNVRGNAKAETIEARIAEHRAAEGDEDPDDDGDDNGDDDLDDDSDDDES